MVNKEILGEGKNIEFKREIPSNHEKFLKDIIAFSNSSGGQIILGVEDTDGSVCGIGDQSPFKLSDAISNMISDACTPQIETNISVQTLEDKTVLVVDVVPGKYRPYYLAGKGKENSTYIRINGTSRPADQRKIKELEMEGQNISYDTLQEIGCEYEERKALELCRKMKQIAVNSYDDEEGKRAVKDMTLEKLLDFGILCKVGRNLCPTHAFNLLTDNKNKASKIQCALFKGATRDIFIDKKEFNGPIYEQVDEAYQFVLRHINTGAEIEGEYRKDLYELPISAIREMIANAVLHRNYQDKSCIQVCIFDDRMEVLSPGMLYGGLDIETAKSGKSTCRNEAIAEAFHYMHIVETWGTGLPRIINRCKEYGLPEPCFQEFGDGFRAVMFRKVSNASEKVSNAPEKVSNAPKKVSNAPEKVSNAPKKVSNAPEKVSNASRKVSNAPGKVSNAPGKVSNAPKKVSNAPGKVSNAPKKVSNASEKVSNAFENYLPMLEKAGVTNTFKYNIEQVYSNCGGGIAFGQANVMEWLACSKSKATNIMNVMKDSKIIKKVGGFGPGKYEFVEL